MSRKFNTKKFIKDVLNGRYALVIGNDKNERINPVRRLIEDGDITFRAEDVFNDLMALLETRLFPTVLTTTTDSYLEASMRKVWDNELPH